MTSRERLDCALRGVQPDRMAVSPLGLGGLDPDGAAARELLASTDMVVPLEPTGDWMLGDLVETEIIRTPDGTRTSYLTEYGPLVRRTRLEAGCLATIEWPVRGCEDVDRLISMPHRPSVPMLDRFRAIDRGLGDEGMAIADLCDAMGACVDLISPHDLTVMWMRHRHSLTDLLEVATARLLAFVAALCDEGVRAFRLVGSSEMAVCVGQEAFAGMVRRFDADLVEGIHRHGGLVLYDQRGPIARLLPVLAEIGVNAVGPVDPPPWGDVADLSAARQGVGAGVCLLAYPGGLVLGCPNVQALLREAEGMIRAAGSSALVLGGCPADVGGDESVRWYLAMAHMVAKGL